MPGEPEPGYINGLLAYAGTEILESSPGSEHPVISKSELDETFNRDMGNEILYLRDRGVLEVASAGEEIYMSLDDRNRGAAIEGAMTLKEYGRNYRELARHEDSVKFLDYSGKFEVPDPGELGIFVSPEEVEEILEDSGDQTRTQ